MRLLLIIITVTLLFWPPASQSEIQDFNNVHYEFTQSSNQYAVRGTFFVKCDPTCLLHIFYDFEHLPNIITDADSFVLLQKGENWYDASYVYSYLLLKGRFVYRKTLNQEQMKVCFEMIESDQPSSILPKVVSSKGYYEIKPEKEGYRVIYFEEVEIGSKLHNEVPLLMAKKEVVKFLKGLKDYVERECY